MIAWQTLRPPTARQVADVASYITHSHFEYALKMLQKRDKEGKPRNEKAASATDYKKLWATDMTAMMTSCRELLSSPKFYRATRARPQIFALLAVCACFCARVYASLTDERSHPPQISTWSRRRSIR